VKANEHNQEWRLTGFYGIPHREQRRESWDSLRTLSQQSTLPWCIVGDFNDIFSNDDKRGHAYTWSRSMGPNIVVEERIDRALVTNAWMNMFPRCMLSNLISGAFDHFPILLETEPRIFEYRKRQFRFENSWLMEPELNQVVEEAATSRKNKNKLTKLSTEDGIKVNTHAGLKILSSDYFTNLFAPTQCNAELILQAISTCLTSNDNKILVALFEEEFCEATFHMHSDKVPGPNGLNPTFYKRFWSLCGKEVITACKHWLNEGTLPNSMGNIDEGTWYPPPADYVKCNIDAAIFSPEKKTSMRACVHNDEGQFITAMSAHINVVMTPAEAEAYARQQGIMWMAMLDYRSVQFITAMLAHINAVMTPT
ncbi:hypothetical protein L195_g027166, partial [Trifolium pratense]